MSRAGDFVTPRSAGWFEPCMFALAVLACGAVAPSGARAAALSGPVMGWSSGVPSYISMYEYIPAKLADSPPIVVAAHYCGGSASAFFGAASGIVAAADNYGFIMIFPQTTNPATSAKCWDVGSKASLTHDGGGDTQAIAQMVKYEVDKRHADPSRVYIMGASSGAMLTEAMLAVYPDVFKAGAEFSGVPAGCWSAGWTAASNWGGQCSGGQTSKTAQQWGDLVRGMYPGYSGFRPRIQLWHGTADTTININNQTEAIKEWTNVLGLPMMPTSSESVSGFKIEKWQASCGFTVLEAHTQMNGGHSTPIDANSVIGFFGLDKPGPDPEPAACGGGSGSGGSGGMPSAGVMAGGSGGAMAAGSGSTMIAGRGSTMIAGRGSAQSAGSSSPMAAGSGSAMLGGRGGAVVAGTNSAMAAGSGARATTGMPSGGTMSAAVGQVANGASANPGTSAPTSSTSATSPSSGGCAVGSGADASGASGALLLILFTRIRRSIRRRSH